MLTGESLVETMFSIQATIGVLIFALMPLLEDFSMKIASEKKENFKFLLYEQIKALAAVFIIATLVDVAYLSVGYAGDIASGVFTLGAYPAATAVFTIVYDLLPILTLVLTFSMVALVVSSGFQTIDTMQRTRRGAKFKQGN